MRTYPNTVHYVSLFLFTGASYIPPRQITTDSMLDSDGRHMVLHNTPTQNCRGPTEKNELGPPKGTT